MKLEEWITKNINYTPWHVTFGFYVIGTCEGCKHWEEQDKDFGIGLCQPSIPMMGMVTQCRHDFGCIHFEENEGKL